MENVEELRREVEEVKERLRQDMGDLREILKRAANGIDQSSQAAAEEAVKKAEQHFEETVSHVEQRFDTAIDAIAGCAGGSEGTTNKLDFNDFNNIEVGCAFKIDIVQSDKYQVSVRTSEFIRDYIDVSKSGNTLKVYLKPFCFDTRPLVEAKIAMPLLNKIRLGAATRGTVRGFNSKELLDIRLSGNSTLDTDIIAGTTKCEISGASRLSGRMQVGDAEFTLSGASRADLSGSAKNIVLNAWGASKAEMSSFKTSDMNVHLNGASEAVINATGNIDIDLNSGSQLIYMDNPTIRNISASGASSLVHKQ